MSSNLSFNNQRRRTEMSVANNPKRKQPFEESSTREMAHTFNMKNQKKKSKRK